MPKSCRSGARIGANPARISSITCISANEASTPSGTTVLALMRAEAGGESVEAPALRAGDSERVAVRGDTARHGRAHEPHAAAPEVAVGIRLRRALGVAARIRGVG